MAATDKQSPRDKATAVKNTGNQKPATPPTYKKGGPVKKGGGIVKKMGGKSC